MKKIIVIGGGAAGIMSAISSAELGADVTLIESNEKLGKKLFITGKGRCNVTNMCETDEFFENIVNGKKFMYSSYRRFNSAKLYDLIESGGIKLKIERGNRVFPESDKSNDIIKALTRLIERNKVKFELCTKVKKISSDSGAITGVLLSDGRTLEADAVIVATGGVSYKPTGSTGDGYIFARTLGHNIIKPKAALSALILKEDVKDIEGLSLKNVKISFVKENKCLYTEIGEMIFTANGISGPIVLSGSSYITNDLDNKQRVKALIDFKPYIPNDELDSRILKDFAKFINKNYQNALDELLPKSLIAYFIKRTNISPYMKINSITKQMRQNIVATLKGMAFEVKETEDLNRAIITSGGVDTKEINPNTMESKLIRGLYFAGEVMDIDALTGGFNLQIAFSTGYVAGISAATP